jgi:phospholipid N-methyltransferase
MGNNSEQDALRSDPLVSALQAGSRGLKFLGAFLREPFTVGSCWPSSSALSRALVGGCEFKPGDTVVELGPGTGAFTELLLERLQ